MTCKLVRGGHRLDRIQVYDEGFRRVPIGTVCLQYCTRATSDDDVAGDGQE